MAQSAEAAEARAKRASSAASSAASSEASSAAAASAGGVAAVKRRGGPGEEGGEALLPPVTFFASFDAKRAATFVGWTVCVGFVIDRWLYSVMFPKWFPARCLATGQVAPPGLFTSAIGVRARFEHVALFIIAIL
jgi:hypothetical protein